VLQRPKTLVVHLQWTKRKPSTALATEGAMKHTALEKARLFENELSKLSKRCERSSPANDFYMLLINNFK
jgi:hypothetical protein